jgi:hypothetical protein
MNIKTTLLAVSAAALLATSAVSFASAADGSRDLFDAPLQNGFVNNDGSAYTQGHAGYGYSTNSSVVSKLTGSATNDLSHRGRDLGDAAPVSGSNN